MRNIVYPLMIVAALTSATGAINAQAYQSYNETYDIMGCASFLASKEQSRGWLLGYLTALERSRGTHILQGRSEQAIFNTFDRYCRANPRSNMDEAADYTLSSFARR